MNPSARPVKRRGQSFRSRRALINSSRSRARGVKPSPAIGDLLAGRAVPSFMAVEKGSLEPLADATETEATAGPVPVPTKRMSLDAAAKESAGGSNTGTEEVTHQTPAAAAAVGEGSSTSPAASSLPTISDGNKLDVRNWMAECRRIRAISGEGILNFFLLYIYTLCSPFFLLYNVCLLF